MRIGIHKPELVQRMNAQIQKRRLHDADELIEQALDALDEKFPPPLRSIPEGNLHEFFMKSPLRGANLDLERAKDYPREIDFE